MFAKTHIVFFHRNKNRSWRGTNVTYGRIHGQYEGVGEEVVYSDNLAGSLALFIWVRRFHQGETRLSELKPLTEANY